ncbi:MAG: hypothetical protein HYZ14_13795 [Bacteroidetes bacterium]|nr:hypothetical protein [Bacteroidota bacterium]
MLCSLVLLQSCYFADDLFLEDPPAPRASLQVSCQNAVGEYIRERITTEKYTAYGFTDVVVHVPQELINLEEMEADRELGFHDGAKTDSIIAAKRAYIEAAHLERTAHLEHFFTLTTGSGDLEVVEANYILNDTFAVMAVEPLTILQIPGYYEQALNYFFHHYTVFTSPDIIEARKLSNAFYTFFKDHLETLNDVSERSAYYYTCIRITELVRVSGVFDPNQVAQMLVRDEQVAATDTALAQKDLAFSPLYEKSTASAIHGYYIFYKFSQTIGGITDTSVLRFDFSPFYEIESKTRINPPYGDFF